MNYTKEKMEKIKKERIGAERKNLSGYLMKVVEYIDSKHIVVEFQDDMHERHTATWQQFINGEIRNNHAPIKRKNKQKQNKKTESKEYVLWKKMMERCFSEKLKLRYPTYENVTCCEEWLIFENFYEWLHVQENWNVLLESNIKFSLDKDILIKENKLYSPDTCCLVPMHVNALFIKRNAARGNYPIGVSKSNNKYVSQWSNNKGKKIRKFFDTIDEAFSCYKIEKEKVIKQVAHEEYTKNTITKQCYEAMINYEVEITD